MDTKKECSHRFPIILWRKVVFHFSFLLAAVQTKLVSVLAMVTSESKGEVISFRQIGRFILPKTLPKTCLGFEFTSETTPSQSSPSPPSLALSQSRSVQANILRFQFLSNYGGRETQPPKIYLFSSTLTTAVSG